MSKSFVVLILITQINYLYFSPASSFKNKNLKEASNKENERKLDSSSDDIIIIHLNDVHCGFNDTIGYDGFVLYRKELEKKYANVISVDVGDHLQGGILGAITDGESVVQTLNKIKFDVVTIGNHEFDYGIEQLNSLNAKMSSKYTSLNACFRKNKTHLFDPYKIIEKGGKKIAFIGIVTPLTFSKTYLSTIKEPDGTATYSFLPDKNELYSTIQNKIDDLKNNQGVNYVILLTHIGKDVEAFTSNEILSNLKGVNAVLDGHTHRVYNDLSKDKDNKDVYIAQTGTKLANIGQLTIKQDGTIISENINEVPEPSDKTGAKKIYRGKADRWVDTEINEFINQKYQEHESELNIKMGHSDFDFHMKSEDGQINYCRLKECTLGNLISDAFREVVQSNISYMNGGGIRENLLKGDITRKNIIEVMPFFNSLFVKEVTGQAILDALEFGVSAYPNTFGGFPQVSGCTFDLDTSFNSTVEKTSDGIFVKVAGKRRVSNVMINGKPLDTNEKYNISSGEYILGGGDGFSMFADFPIVNETVFADNDALGHYIKYHLNGEIPSEYKEVQNRISNSSENSSGKHKSMGEFLKLNKKFLALIFLILM